MKEFILTQEETERTVLVGLITNTQNEAKANEYLDELAFLAETAGALPVKKFLQRLDTPNSRTFVGSGKLSEIKAYNKSNQCNYRTLNEDRHNPLSDYTYTNCHKRTYHKVIRSPARNLALQHIFLQKINMQLLHQEFNNIGSEHTVHKHKPFHRISQKAWQKSQNLRNSDGENVAQTD